MNRRDILACFGAAAALPAWAASTANRAHPGLRLAAAWDSESQHHVGVLVVVNGRLQVKTQLDVPTRAHGLWREPAGTWLAVARRPGDWLMRWRANGPAMQWAWSEPQRALNGHVLASADGNTLFTTETDLDSGLGLIGVRDALTLEKRAEWQTHGMDPHELVWGPNGELFVANGGIASLPESGRRKIALERMDSSLVQINASSGQLQRQWRLPDRRLSIRHLAWNGQLLGMALQAEHDDAEERANAPVLAVLDGNELSAISPPQPLAGYGGDIAACNSVNSSGFAVSCPRANCVAVWQAEGGWQASLQLHEACALAETTQGTVVGGRTAALLGQGQTRVPVTGLRLDNHWISVG